MAPKSGTTPPSKVSERARELRFSLHELAAFVAVARSGSTRAGAERLARSQAAASAALASLESALEAPLFDRIGRRLMLNDAGRALLPRAEALLEQASALQDGMRNPAAQPLRVAASLTIGEYILPRLLAQWQPSHPGSPVQLRVGNTSSVLQALADFEAELGFIEGPQTHPDLVVTPWLTDRMVICCAPSHPLASATNASRAQLAEATWALREPGSGTRVIADGWLFDQLGTIQVGFEAGSTEAVKQLVASGACIACLSMHALDHAIAQGWLVEVKSRLKPPERKLAIVRHRQRPLRAQAAVFMEACRSMG